MRKNYEGNTGGGGVNVTGYFEGNDWGYYWDGGLEESWLGKMLVGNDGRA